MIPKGSDGIDQIKQTALSVLIPGVEDAYTATNIHYMCQLLLAAAKDFDRAADNLASEFLELKELFERAGRQVVDEDLRTRLAAAAAMESKSLRVSDLAVRSDEALRVLIDLHEVVEIAREKGASWAEEIDGMIWRFLDSYVERRKF